MNVRLTEFQRAVLGVAAMLIALRLVFPVYWEYRIDVVGTLLQVLAVLALSAAVMLLGPSVGRWLRRAALAMLGPAVFLGWASYLGGIVVAWAQGVRFGWPPDYALTGAAIGGPVILVWLTWQWKRVTVRP